jgi:hypothetical protein
VFAQTSDGETLGLSDAVSLTKGSRPDFHSVVCVQSGQDDQDPYDIRGEENYETGDSSAGMIKVCNYLSFVSIAFPTLQSRKRRTKRIRGSSGASASDAAMVNDD